MPLNAAVITGQKEGLLGRRIGREDGLAVGLRTDYEVEEKPQVGP